MSKELCPNCGYQIDDCKCTCPYCGETTNCECCIGSMTATGG